MLCGSANFRHCGVILCVQHASQSTCSAECAIEELAATLPVLVDLMILGVAGWLNRRPAIVRSGQHFIKLPVAMQISDQRV
jgi:hypothetical protein